MPKDQLARLVFTGLVGGIMFYSGYLWGTHRMSLAYGEVMSAEAIMYLAALDAENDD